MNPPDVVKEPIDKSDVSIESEDILELEPSSQDVDFSSSDETFEEIKKSKSSSDQDFIPFKIDRNPDNNNESGQKENDLRMIIRAKRAGNNTDCQINLEKRSLTNLERIGDDSLGGIYNPKKNRRKKRSRKKKNEEISPRFCRFKIPEREKKYSRITHEKTNKKSIVSHAKFAESNRQSLVFTTEKNLSIFTNFKEHNPQLFETSDRISKKNYEFA